MEKPQLDDIKKFREYLYNNLKTNLFDFDSYISNELYRRDIQNDLSITIELLINRGIEILISKFHEIGIFIYDDSFLNNFYDCSIYLDIYTFLQPNNIIPLLLSLKQINNLIIDDITDLLYVSETEQVDLKLYDFFDILKKYNSSTEIDDYYMFINYYLYSDKTFLIYMKNILKLVNYSQEQEDLNNNINLWIQYIIRLKQQILNNEDISSDIIYNNLNKWLSELLKIPCSYLVLKYLENKNNLNDLQLNIIRSSYNNFQKTTIGYLPYYEINNIEIDNNINELIQIINKYDIIKNILEKNEDIL